MPPVFFHQGQGAPRPPAHGAKKYYTAEQLNQKRVLGRAQEDLLVVLLTCWIVWESGVPGGGLGSGFYQLVEKYFNILTTGTVTLHIPAPRLPCTRFPAS